MLIVDSHCHAGESWFEPIEMLLRQMDSNDVEKAVLIQHKGAYDNSYLFECAAMSPRRFAVVVLVDMSQPDAPSVLDELASQGAAGVRIGPIERSSGDDALAVWRKAADLGLPVSSLGTLDDFTSQEFEKVMVDSLVKTRFEEVPAI